MNKNINSDDFLQTGEINSRNNFKNSLSSLKLNSNSSSESTSTLVSNKYDLDYLAKKGIIEIFKKKKKIFFF